MYLLIFRTKLNIQVKRKAAVFGFLAFILVHWLIPFILNEWESRPIFIEHELDSIYTMNFQHQHELIKLKINKEKNGLKLENFEVHYVKDGRITDLSWELIGQNDNGYSLYRIRYDIDKSEYKIMHREQDSWLQYERLIYADHFFENLNMLDIKEITDAKGNYSSYGIQGIGERTNYGIENRPHFVVSNEETKLLNDAQLPVESYYISTYAIKKIGEEKDDHGNIVHESFESTELSDYLFDVNYLGEQ